MKKLLLVLVLIVLYSGTAIAGPRTGALQLQLAGIIGDNSQKKTDTVDGTILLSVGYFFTDRIKLGLSETGTFTSTKVNSSTTTTGMSSTSVFANFYDVMPWEWNKKPSDIFHGYLGPHLGYSIMGSGNGSISGSAIGAHTGFEAYITDDTALNGELRYTNNSFSGKGVSSSSNDYRALIGFTVLFGG